MTVPLFQVLKALNTVMGKIFYCHITSLPLVTCYILRNHLPRFICGRKGCKPARETKERAICCFDCFDRMDNGHTLRNAHDLSVSLFLWSSPPTQWLQAHSRAPGNPVLQCLSWKLIDAKSCQLKNGCLLDKRSISWLVASEANLMVSSAFSSSPFFFMLPKEGQF